MEPHRELERRWASWNGLPPEGSVGCSSGTTALHLCLESLRLPQGSEVVTADFSMIACPRACTLAGLVPVLVDCRPDLLMDPGLIEDAITDRTSAILAVHVYGRRCDMGAVAKAAEKNGLRVVEDLAELHGVPPHPASDAAAWSLYRNKTVNTSAEGGMMSFRDPRHAELARSLRCLGFAPEHDYMHLPRAVNGRLADPLAERAIVSLFEAPANIRRRREIEGWYDRGCPPEWRMPPRDAVWVYDLRVPGLTRARQAEVVRALNAEGVAARMGFAPMSSQEEYRGCRLVGNGNAARLSDEVFYLPCDPRSVTEESCARAFEVIRRALP